MQDGSPLVSTEFLERKRSQTKERLENQTDRFAAYYDKPAEFFQDILKIKLWDRQREVIEAIRTAPMIAVRSGHKVGKSLSACGLALWFVATRPKARVILVSAGQRQIKGILWKELTNLHRSCKNKLGGKLAKDPATGLQFEDGREILGFTSNEPERMAGFSGENLLFILDEASGIPDPIYEVIQGNTAGIASIIAFSNPTRTEGFFFEAFRSDSSLWKTFHISSEETPNVKSGKIKIPGLAAREWINARRREWGPDYQNNPRYLIRVLGEFPEQASDSVVPLGALDEAKERYSAAHEGEGTLRIGVDVARFGDDETVIQPVRGKHAFPPVAISNADGPTVANEIKKTLVRYKHPTEEPIVNVDGIGVGASVVDSCRQLNIKVQDINVGSKADDSKNYVNLRAQLWFGIEQWLKDGGELYEDSRLESELLAARYFFDGEGKIQIERKVEIRKRLHRSPDRADALALALYLKIRGGAGFISGVPRKTARLRDRI